MKKFIIIALIVITTTTLTACSKELIFDLIGESEVSYTVDSDYVEKGFLARVNNEDLSEYVTIDSDIDPTQAGDYTVTYTLDYEGDVRTLTRTVYYREDGCTVIDGTDLTECQVFWTQYLHTVVKLRIYYQGDTYNGAVANIFDNVELLLDYYHKLSDKYNNYNNVTNVKTINDDPTATHVIDEPLFDMIQFALDHQDEVDDLFNIALGPVLLLWHDYRESCLTNFTDPVCEVPPMEQLQARNAFTDPAGITMDETNHTITMESGMSLDLGGMSKGFISRVLIEYLDDLNLHGYLLNNGESNISIGGTHPTRENGKFLLAITDPTFETSYYATVYLGAGDQLVTSGDYQQYYEVDGEIYHHIINPNTLMPERYSRSVSIVTDDPALADIYSTAIFTMPLVDGLAFVNGIDNLEAIWYTIDDQIVFSDGFEAQYLDDTYK